MKGHQRQHQGSFGIPPEMKEAQEKAEAKKRAEAEEAKRQSQEEENQAQPKQGAGDLGFGADMGGDKEAADSVKPVEALKKIGIDFTPEDFQSLLFRGFVEKEVVVVKNPKGKNFVATVRTLSGDDYHLVDEHVAADIKGIQMTNSGYDTRRNMWILSYAVQKLMGNSVWLPKENDPMLAKLKALPDEDEADKRITMYRASKKFETISMLSPAVLNKLMKIHGVFASSMTLMVEDEHNPFLKES